MLDGRFDESKKFWKNFPSELLAFHQIIKMVFFIKKNIVSLILLHQVIILALIKGCFKVLKFRKALLFDNVVLNPAVSSTKTAGKQLMRFNLQPKSISQHKH